MAGEAFVLNDGQLAWIAASGIDGGWKTASGAARMTAVTFVEGMTLQSGQRQFSPIRDRGEIKQIRFMQNDMTTVTVSHLYDGDLASGVVPTGYVNLEYLQNIGGLNSAWVQMQHAQKTNLRFVERAEGNMIEEEFVVTNWLFTGSGYILAAT